MSVILFTLGLSSRRHTPPVHHATLARNRALGNAVQGNAPSVITLDLLRVALRWVHLTAAVIWIGGTFFYLFVIRPSVDTAGKSRWLEED